MSRLLLLQPRLLPRGPRRWLTARPAASPAAAPSVGDRLHGFEVQQVEALPELSATASRLVHRPTGAQFLHLSAPDDTNNVFAVGFRTTPSDSTGVAHILEHTVLCGSERFPARDPFFKMLNRSLATFMNAFTASDWTLYPFSTCNQADYMNLLSVYMDAVFCPRLERLDFLQEGWRLEHENPDDKDSPIVFKGVVYNEMKGALADSHRLFGERLQNGLLPSHTYQHCSGGDPQHIPSLSWEQLRQFHATHYHPANCRMFAYGSFPLEPQLRYISENYLSLERWSGTPAADTSVPLEPRWSEPRRLQVTCPPDPLAAQPDKQNSVAVSFLLGDVTDAYDTFMLQILSELLVSGPSAPFYRALLEQKPPLGSDYVPYVNGLDNSCRQTAFTVGLQGVSEADTDRILQTIDRTITEVVEQGFDMERVEAILHRIELGLKHRTKNFGLGLVLHTVAPWNHDGSPLHGLQVNQLVSRFRSELADNPRLLQDRLAACLRDNPHRLTASMRPDPGHDPEQRRREAVLLQQHLAQLSDTDRQEVYRLGQLLAEKQAAGEQGIEALPMLQISDIPDQPDLHPVNTETVSSVPVQLCRQPTNGVTYFRAFVDTSGVPAYFKPLLPLFCQLLTQMGSRRADYRQQDQQIQLRTGGLSASVSVTDDPVQAGRFEEGLLLSSYCLEHNTEHMFQLWQDIFTGLVFENADRLRSLLQMYVSELGNGVPMAGHQYAMGVSSSRLSQAAQLRQLYSGLQQLRFSRSLAQDDTAADMLATKMTMLAEMLLQRDGMRCALNAGGDGLRSAVDLLNGRLLSHLSGEGSADGRVLPPFSPEPGRHTYVQLPLPVHYTALSVPTVPYTHPDFAALRVLARLLSTGHLHTQIRERGGAYGGGAVASAGLWSFFSYRDPNSLSTLDTFRACADHVAGCRLSQQQLDGAKLGVFQSVDAPVVPADRGMRQFLSHISDQQYSEHRLQLKAVTGDDLRRVAETYLRRPAAQGACVLGQPCHTQLDSSWVVEES